MKNTIRKKDNIDVMAEVKKDKRFKEYSDGATVRIKLAVEIYNARKKKKLSQQKLAKEINSTQKIVSYLENGDINVGIELLQRIIKKLDFDSGVLARIFNCCVPVPYWFTQSTTISKKSETKDIEKDLIVKE